MKQQWLNTKSSEKYSFFKKVNLGYNKIYQALCDSYETDRISGCTTSHEASTMKYILYTASKLLYNMNRHLRNMKRTYGFQLPTVLEGLLSKTERAAQVKKLNKKKLQSIKNKDLVLLKKHYVIDWISYYH